MADDKEVVEVPEPDPVVESPVVESPVVESPAPRKKSVKAAPGVVWKRGEDGRLVGS